MNRSWFDKYGSLIFSMEFEEIEIESPKDAIELNKYKEAIRQLKNHYEDVKDLKLLIKQVLKMVE